MVSPLDLNLLSVSRAAGRDAPELLGLLAAEPPRRSARSRSHDQLILYFNMAGNAPLSPGRRDQALAELANIFYQTQGSVTSAMRAVAVRLNKFLLERNLSIASTGRQGLGSLTQVVVRGGQVTLAQSGPAQAFLITAQGTRQLLDPEAGERNLGQSRTAPLSFSLASLAHGDTLILAFQPPVGWNSDQLGGLHGQGPEGLRRRLFSQADADVNAVLLQARPGKGRLYTRSLAASPPLVEQAAAPAQDQAVSPPPVTPSEGVTPPSAPVSPSAAPEGQAKPEVRATVGRQPSAAGAAHIPPIQKSAGLPFVSQVKRAISPLGRLFVRVGEPLLKFILGGLRSARVLAGRLLPSEPFQALPSGVMASIAIVVPVIIVTVAVMAYSQLGRAAQFEALYNQAQQKALEATGQTDVMARRAAWQAVLDILGQAEGYRSTPETQALRSQARLALDDLELVRRLDYQPAIAGNLPAAVNVTRIVISENDLYLLDATSGSVLRAELKSSGYQLDASFQCGPNQPLVSVTAPVIDITAWPAGFKPSAVILALDASGNLFYCRVGEPPEVVRLAAPPSGSWNRLAGIALELTDLYILDPGANAVYSYWENNFSDQPHLFFDEEIPPIADVIGMTVSRDDLYLLHADGRLTLCLYNVLAEVPTRCSDLLYTDNRPGREGQPMVPAEPFTQFTATPSPDLALYFLEPKNQAVYHFSLHKLLFQRQYLPRNILPGGNATALTVNPIRREIFLALGHLVYYAIFP